MPRPTGLTARVSPKSASWFPHWRAHSPGAVCTWSPCPSTTPRTSACSCVSCRSVSSQQRDVHIQLLDPAGSDREHAQFVLEIARESGCVRNTVPWLDTDERRVVGLGPDAEIGGVGVVHSQSRTRSGAVRHGMAAQVVENDHVVAEQRVIEYQAPVNNRCWLTLPRQESMTVQTPDQRAVIALKLDEMRFSRLPVGQGP